MIDPLLSQGAGWGIVIGFGAYFTIVMILLTIAQKHYLRESESSEMFMTARRSIKPGLIASAIVSSWTWAATLLQSTTVAYRYGVSGPFWYASGATVQVLLFSVLAIELKRKAPNAHTFLEIIHVRYGKTAHIVFLCFALATNMIVTAMLLLGGSAVINALTGVNVAASCFLLPAGVLIYTHFGGIKATFLTDYIHTTIIFIIIISFSFIVYCSSSIGSPQKMYDLLIQASHKNPVEGNEKGSYLTMSSSQGLVFGIINIIGNFGTIFVDNAYWQRAIASRPSSVVKAYLIGGLSWFAIPFTLATTMGISAVALSGKGEFDNITDSDISAGLVLPLAASKLLGDTGAFAVLVLVFMAVTSAASAELIAVSSIYTYDIYRTYISPMASGEQAIAQSRYSIICFGIFMGALAIILKSTNIKLEYLYLLMGIISSPAVIPITFTITWRKQSRKTAIGASIIGILSGIFVWLGTTMIIYGEITILSTGKNHPMLAGNVTSLLVSLVVTTIWSLISPDNFDFEQMHNALRTLDDDGTIVPQEPDRANLRKSFRFAVWCSFILTLILIIIWPLPMYFSKYVFSSEFFTFWVVISIVWAILGAYSVVIYPVYESRKSIYNVSYGILFDIRRLIEKVTTTLRKH
ncbi:8624_t:CDS:2 [Acaulospora morrowiae]|uniref:8624_t:CDS:1 n=1 Tax=Acaulospora morrowiae TaxID=94023 RepID=A0A9N9B9D4_9GLOM|nr:8624_t:CDS:2 [Acaulospora morrowiae]